MGRFNRIGTIFKEIVWLIYDLLFLLTVFLFGWSWKHYEAARVWTIKQKENVVSIYKRQIYKELRFFHS